MIYLPSFLSFLAAAFLLLLVLLNIREARRSIQKVLFIISALIFAAGVTALGFMLMATTKEQVLSTFQVSLACSLLFPVIGVPFFLSFGRDREARALARHLPLLIAVVAFAGAATALLPADRVVQFIRTIEGGPFYDMSFTGWGKLIAIYLLLANVFFLYRFENTYRAAGIPARVMLKYPLLGIITASLINFVVLSRVIAIAALDRTFLAIEISGIIIITLSFLYTTIRYHLFEVQPYIGREIVSSVLTLIVAGLYFLALALISTIAVYFGTSFDRLTFSVLGTFAVFLLAAVLISGKARKRIRRFVNENFYFDRYDYRKEWRRYARLMASSPTIDVLIENVISSLCETMLVSRGLMWVSAKGERIAFYGIPTERPSGDLIEVLHGLAADEPVNIYKPGEIGTSSTDIKPGIQAEADWIRAAALIGYSGETRGMIVLGEKELGASYTDEDTGFLATIADQAATTLENLLLTEKFLESSRMESFNRFASFIIHDLKNTLGMLSLTAENARANIGNPEFQQDMVETLQRSVEKVKELISSLSAQKYATSVAGSETEMVPLLRESIEPLYAVAESRGIRLEFRCNGEFRAKVEALSMKRIVDNIILNAIEATPPGGFIRVSAEPVGGKRAAIQVTDTGPGFDPEYLRNKLFHPFQSTKEGGIGIGLVLCKSLVEAHGGTISVENVPGAGARVSIHLPMVPGSWRNHP